MEPAKKGAGRKAARDAHSARSRAQVAFLLGERRDALQAAGELFGRRLRRWEYAGLAGAPDDARVEVGTLAGDLYLEMHHDLPDRYCGFLFVRAAGDEPVLVNDGFRIHRETMQRNGLGLRIFRRQLCQSKALGIRRIEVTAGRSRAENGYYTWPRFGMDGPLPPAIRRVLPPGLRRARSVLDLTQSEPGRWWWKAHGCCVELAFDLADGSRCWEVFQEYFRSRLGAGCRDGGNRPAAIE